MSEKDKRMFRFVVVIVFSVIISRGIVFVSEIMTLGGDFETVFDIMWVTTALAVGFFIMSFFNVIDQGKKSEQTEEEKTDVRARSQYLITLTIIAASFIIAPVLAKLLESMGWIGNSWTGGVLSYKIVKNILSLVLLLSGLYIVSRREKRRKI